MHIITYENVKQLARQLYYRNEIPEKHFSRIVSFHGLYRWNSPSSLLQDSTENETLFNDVILNVDLLNECKNLNVTVFNDQQAITYDESLKEISTRDDLTIYSLYSKELYESFSDLFVPESFEGTSVYNFYQHLRTLRSRESNIYTKPITSNNTNLTLLLNQLHSQVNIDENDETLIDVIELKSFCTKNTYDFIKTKIPIKNFYTSKKTYAAPLLFKTQVYDHKEEINKEAYIFTYTTNDLLLTKFIKYRKARNYILKLQEYLFKHDGTYFYNRELYNEKRYASPVKKYVSEDEFDDYSYLNNVIKHVSRPFASTNTLNTVFSQPRIPTVLSQKKLKLEVSRVETNNSIADKFVSLNKALANKKDIYLYKKKIQNLKQDIISAEETLNNLINSNKIENYINDFQDLSSSFRRKKALSNKLNELDKNITQVLKTIEPTISPTLLNLLNQIQVHNLIYSDPHTSKRYFPLSESFNEWDEFKQLLAEEKLHLSEFSYSTLTPTIIKVDGKDSDKRIAGPFHLQVKDQRLYLKPKSIDSYFVLERSGSTYTSKPHPHSSKQRINSDNKFYFDWSSACLGEVGGMYYNAIKSANLISLLITIDMWLKSANSSDAWGKDYVLFPKYEDHIEYEKLNEKSLLEEESIQEEVQEPPLEQNLQELQQVEEPINDQNLVLPPLNLNHEATVQNAVTYTPYLPQPQN